MSFAIYVKKQYTHHRPDFPISTHSHATKARNVLSEKYNQNRDTFNSIHWDSHSLFINKVTDNKRRSALRFTHHRLLTGNMQLDV